MRYQRLWKTNQVIVEYMLVKKMDEQLVFLKL